MDVNLILLKNAGRDCNGLPNYIFATDSQVATINEMRNNPDERYNFCRIGKYIFSPIDILYIKKEKDYGGAIPQYFIERYKKDWGCC